MAKKKKKPQFKAPEGQFERLSEVNSVRIPVELENGKLPVDIGIELPDGRMQVLVKRNEPIPFWHSEMYSTAIAYQTAVEAHFLLGNRPLAKDNLSLGRIRLRNIRWSNQGLPMIDMLVGMDGQGTLSLGSNNLDRTEDKGAVISQSGPISADDLRRLAENAESHQAEDEEWRTYLKESDEARQFINELADIYIVAKKKMGFAQKHAHNKVVNRVCKVLNSPVKKLTPQSIAQFREDIATLKASLPQLHQLRAAVMRWYR